MNQPLWTDRCFIAYSWWIEDEEMQKCKKTCEALSWMFHPTFAVMVYYVIVTLTLNLHHDLCRYFCIYFCSNMVMMLLFLSGLPTSSYKNQFRSQYSLSSTGCDQFKCKSLNNFLVYKSAIYICTKKWLSTLVGCRPSLMKYSIEEKQSSKLLLWSLCLYSLVLLEIFSLYLELTSLFCTSNFYHADELTPITKSGLYFVLSLQW